MNLNERPHFMFRRDNPGRNKPCAVVLRSRTVGAALIKKMAKRGERQGKRGS